MKRIGLAVALLALAGVAAGGAATRAQDERVLRQLKQELWPRAYREGDVALLDSILAPEFQRVDAEGRWSSKSQELQAVARHRPAWRAFRFEIARLEVFENDSAIVAGRGVIAGAEGDPQRVLEYQSTNVLIKRAGRWQALASHVSGVRPLAAAGVRSACPPPTLTRPGLLALKAAGFALADDEQRQRTALLWLDCLDDPDPALRDGVVFEGLSRWLRTQALTADTRRELARRLMGALRAAAEDRAGFRGPFAALVLSEVARADRLQPVLDPAVREELVELAARYLTGIDDYRGFDPREGWRHGVAHGADLALQLGLHPALSAAQARRLAEALARQVAPPGELAYVFGEPERLARAVFYLYGRGLLEAAFWEPWLAGLGSPQPLSDWSQAHASLAGLAKRHNTLAFLHALAFAGRTSADEAGRRLSVLVERELVRVTGG